jgi:mannose/fructose/N-acetylgalactosamine-specific phosphotransferase system component IIC
MENFDDFENKSYESARKIKYKTIDHVKFVWNLITVVIKVTCIVIAEGFSNFLQLFKSQKPKEISGQLALVTGLLVILFSESFLSRT